jgi:hypothetical protein
MMAVERSITDSPDSSLSSRTSASCQRGSNADANEWRFQGKASRPDSITYKLVRMYEFQEATHRKVDEALQTHHRKVNREICHIDDS